ERVDDSRALERFRCLRGERRFEPAERLRTGIDQGLHRVGKGASPAEATETGDVDQRTFAKETEPRPPCASVCGKAHELPFVEEDRWSQEKITATRRESLAPAAEGTLYATSREASSYFFTRVARGWPGVPVAGAGTAPTDLGSVSRYGSHNHP